MPKVSGKKSSTTARGRSRRKAPPPPPTIGERISGFFSRLFHLAVTYTAVSVVGLVIIAGLMLLAGGYFSNFGTRVVNLSKDMTTGAGLGITRVTWSGATQTAGWEVTEALLDESRGILMHQSILHFSPEQARLRIEELGWVRNAAVTRLLPNTIHVSIEERIPAALWQRDGSGRLYLVDRDGTVITEVGGHQYTGLPLLIDTTSPVEANEILTELARYPELAARIGDLRHQGGRRWDLRFRNGFVVMLPEDDYAAAIDRIAVLESRGKLSDSMEKLDLRLPNAVYYTPKDGQGELTAD